jgi:hypothetical protein
MRIKLSQCGIPVHSQETIMPIIEPEFMDLTRDLEKAITYTTTCLDALPALCYTSTGS